MKYLLYILAAFGVVFLFIAFFGRVKYQTHNAVLNKTARLPKAFRIKDIFRGGTDGFIMAKLQFKDDVEEN
jgi:hypothetical protein